MAVIMYNEWFALEMLDLAVALGLADYWPRRA